MPNWSLEKQLGIYYFLSDLGVKIELCRLYLAKVGIDKTDNDINFYFIDFMINKPGKINVDDILNLIWEPVVPNYSFLLFLFLASF